MSRVLRIFKASATIGAIWGVVWGGGAAALALLAGLGGDPFPWSSTGELAGFMAAVFGGLGFAGGTVFSLGLAAAERKRVLEDVSRVTVGLLGALGGTLALPAGALALSLLSSTTSMTLELGGFAIMGFLGAGSSLITLGVARSGPALEAGEGAPDGRLSAGE